MADSNPLLHGLLIAAFGVFLVFMWQRIALDKRRIEHEQREAVLGSLVQGVVVHSAGKPLFANQAVSDMLGFQPRCPWQKRRCRSAGRSNGFGHPTQRRVGFAAIADRSCSGQAMAKTRYLFRWVPLTNLPA